MRTRYTARVAICLAWLAVGACDGTSAGAPDIGTIVRIGTQPPGSEDPSEVDLLGPHDELSLVFGHQGSWMVVLTAVFENYPFDQAVYVIGLYEGDIALAELRFRRPRSVTRESSGIAYIYNIFLVTEPYELFANRELVLRLETTAPDLTETTTVEFPVLVRPGKSP